MDDVGWMEMGEPRPPKRCERHGEDTVDITAFGEAPRSGVICLYCSRAPGISADVLYAAACATYAVRRHEWDRWTPRIEELEAELRR